MIARMLLKQLAALLWFAWRGSICMQCAQHEVWAVGRDVFDTRASRVQVEATLVGPEKGWAGWWGGWVDGWVHAIRLGSACLVAGVCVC